MMLGSPVVAIVCLTLAFAFIYAGIKNESIIDVLSGKSSAIQPGIIGGALNPQAIAPLVGQASTPTAPTQTTKMA